MFEKHWWSRTITSDEGFTVTFVARHTLMYEEGGKSVTIRTEGDGKSIDVFKNSIGRWSDNPSEVDAPTNERIANNVAPALKSRGFSVYVTVS